MADFKKSNEGRDYKETFEFRLTVGDNIICQRYFKINNFNVASLRSYDLVRVIRNCAHKIDKDLKEKTQIYLEFYAPRYFESIDEMNRYISNPELNIPGSAFSLHLGEGLVVKGSDVDYFWNGHEAKECSYKFDDGELYGSLSDDDVNTYKFSFLIDGKEVVSTIWDGVYPKYIRNSIDLSNKRGKFEGEDLSRLSFDQYILYRLVNGRQDLVWGLIRDICDVCSYDDIDDYDVDGYGYENKYERVIDGINDYETIQRNKRYQNYKKRQEANNKKQ